MTFHFWRARILEAVVALMLAFLVIQTLNADKAAEREAEWQRRESLPVSEWFVVNEVAVPDHPRGEDPSVLYDRAVREPFVGFWIAEVQAKLKDGQFQNACTGTGANSYDTSDGLADPYVRLSWYLDRVCDVPPGEYRIKTSYTLTRPGWPEKELRTYSNVFTVYPTQP